jgi:hypothetical protein
MINFLTVLLSCLLLILNQIILELELKLEKCTANV